MRRNLFLFLALACFLGLIAIFVVDGYLGIYDTLEITAREQPQTIEADEWLRQEKFGARGVSLAQDEKASFTYKVDNRKFSTYEADIEVSVSRNEQKVLDVTSQQILIAAFDKGQVTWEINAAELLPDEVIAEQGYNFTVIIKRGEIERNIILYINPRTYPSEYPEKPVPVPAR